MTVSSTPRRAGPYAINGVTTAFPFNFKVFEKSDVGVVLTLVDGSYSFLVQDSDYTISLNADQDNNPGGTVTYTASGTTLTMLGTLPAEQDTDITNVGRFLPQVLENALDKQTILIQQLQEVSDRTLQAAPGTSVKLAFPAPSAGKFIRWRPDLSGLENADASDNPGLQGLLAEPTGASRLGFIQAGDGAVATTVQTQLRGQTKLISNYLSLAVAFWVLGGGAALGYGMDPVVIDLQNQAVDIGSGELFRPINITLINGEVKSTTGGQIEFASPYVKDNVTRPRDAYYPWMAGNGARNVRFNCRTIFSCLIRGVFESCYWQDQYSHAVFVNSDLSWTEDNKFLFCEFAAKAGQEAILIDGNVLGTSLYSVGAGPGPVWDPGTPDGSFGYNIFEGCKIDSTAPKVGVRLLGGAVLYNAKLGFHGYARDNDGGIFYFPADANPARIAYCNFDISCESFGAAANIISQEAGSQLWYNYGSIRSASPEMKFYQAEPGQDNRANNISVIGAVLEDSGGNVVFNGATVQSTVFANLTRRRSIQPKFRAHRSASVSFTSNTTVQISMDAIDADTASDMGRPSASGGGFNPKFEGWYSVAGKLRLATAGATRDCGLELRLNGVVISSVLFGARDPTMERQISETLKLNGTTDLVTLHAFGFDNAGPPQIVGGSVATSICANFEGY